MTIETLFDMSQVVKSRELGGRHFDWIHWDLVKRHANAYKNKDGLIDTFFGVDPQKRRRKTWGQVYNDVNLMIFHMLDNGLCKEDMLITQVPNCIENVYASYASSKIGNFYAKMQVELGENEVMKTLEHTNPKIAIIVKEYHGRELAQWYLKFQEKNPSLKKIYVMGNDIPDGCSPVSELFDVGIRKRYSDDILDYLKTSVIEPNIIIPTGGTTGMPKLCLHTTLEIAHVHSACIADRMGFTAEDRCLVFGPLNGGTGMVWGIDATTASASTIILLTDFTEEDACRITEEEKATLWIANPILMGRAFNSSFFEKCDKSSLKLMGYSGAPFSPDVAEKVFSLGIKIGGLYGTSEIGACVIHKPYSDSKEELIYTNGKLIEGYDVAVIDPTGKRLPPGESGEVIIWNIHCGYFNMPEEQKEQWDDDGYQHTGDVGVWDEKGNLKIVGRLKDMILRGAQNVFPKEIEDILIKHPKVREVAIVGMPDKDLGEKICAFIATMDGSEMSLKDVTEFLTGKKVTKFQLPERVEIIKELPTSPGGKIMKPKLVEIITQKLKEEGQQV